MAGEFRYDIVNDSTVYVLFSDFGFSVRSNRLLGWMNNQGGIDDLIGRKGSSFRSLLRWDFSEEREWLCGARMSGRIGRSGDGAEEARRFAVRIR